MSGIAKFFTITFAVILYNTGRFLVLMAAVLFNERGFVSEGIITFYIACALTFLALFIVSLLLKNKIAKWILRGYSFIPLTVAFGYTFVFIFA